MAARANCATKAARRRDARRDELQEPVMLAPNSLLEPGGPSKAVVESTADRQHQQQGRGITERPLQLRHVFEVHAVNTGDRRRHGKDRGPAAELLDDIVLSGRRKKKARLEDGRQALAQINDRLVYQQHVVADIAKIRFDRRASAVRKVLLPPQHVCWAIPGRWHRKAATPGGYLALDLNRQPARGGQIYKRELSCAVSSVVPGVDRVVRT